jgi:hypothetical protein
MFDPRANGSIHEITLLTARLISPNTKAEVNGKNSKKTQKTKRKIFSIKK